MRHRGQSSRPLPRGASHVGSIQSSPERQPGRAGARRPRSRLRTTLVVAAIALAGGLIGARPRGPEPGHVRSWLRPPRLHARADGSREGAAARRALRQAHLAVELDATTEQQDRLAGTAREAVKDRCPSARRCWRRASGRSSCSPSRPSTAPPSRPCAPSRSRGRTPRAKRLARALGDAAEVLTLEQRKKLAERIEEMRERRRGRGHGWWHRG